MTDINETNIDIDGKKLLIDSKKITIVFFKEHEQLRQKLLWNVKREVNILIQFN